MKIRKRKRIIPVNWVTRQINKHSILLPFLSYLRWERRHPMIPICQMFHCCQIDNCVNWHITGAHTYAYALTHTHLIIWYTFPRVLVFQSVFWQSNNQIVYVISWVPVTFFVIVLPKTDRPFPPSLRVIFAKRLFLVFFCCKYLLKILKFFVFAKLWFVFVF